MLVPTRKVEESIWVGDMIEVKVCEIRGDRVKLAIESPKSMAINRSEPTTPPPSSGAAEDTPVVSRMADGSRNRVGSRR